VASLLKRARLSRPVLIGAALWVSAVAGSIALIFVPSQGFPASALFIAFAALVMVRYRATGLDALPLGIALSAVGLALGAIPVQRIRDVADGIVACAIIIVLWVLFQDAAARRAAATLDRPTVRVRLAALRTDALLRLLALLRRVDDATWRRLWVGVATAAVLLVVAIGGGSARSQQGWGWKLVGGPDGAAVWNAAFLETSLQREGPHLRDPEIVTADGSPPRVGIADSPLLTAAKLVFPARWTGPEIANLLAVLDLTALLFCAVLFIAALAGTSGGAAIAVVAALVVSPLLRQVGATAPFDLWPALAVATLAMRRTSLGLVAAGAVLGLLNVAGGYEIAVLALGLGLAGRLSPRFAWAIGAAGVAGSLAGAFVSRALSPDATTLALWWSTNALAHLVGASGIAWPWILTPIALAAIVAGWLWSVKNRDRGARDAGIAAMVAAALAIPALLGGVPLLVPARLLDVVPLGWPTARILAIATVLLVVPVAVAIRLVVGRADGRRTPLRALAFLALAVAGFAIGRPTMSDLLLPPIPAGSDAVELPIAESGSRASFVFADDLLERGARISQPVPYVSAPTLLPGGGTADLAIDMLRKRPGPAFIVVRLDVYADPAQRFAQPTVIDAVDYAVPNIGDDPRAALTSLTDQARVYQLVR
jgi:hypothetical protein